MEPFQATIKEEYLYPDVSLSLDETRAMVKEFIAHDHNVRLYSAISYVAPVNKLNGREREIFKERERKLEEAREQRRQKRLLALKKKQLL